jgi:hypothetical protein
MDKLVPPQSHLPLNHMLLLVSDYIPPLTRHVMMVMMMILSFVLIPTLTFHRWGIG